MKLLLLLAVFPAMLLMGCQTPAEGRRETIAFGGGNAIAANSAMQIVDPWPPGSRDTDLAVPADLEQYKPPVTAAGEEGGTVAAGEAEALTQ